MYKGKREFIRTSKMRYDTVRVEDDTRGMTGNNSSREGHVTSFENILRIRLEEL